MPALSRLRTVVLAAVIAAPGPTLAATLADVEAAEALDTFAVALTRVQADVLELCAAAPAAERFELYRAYNRSVGTALQVAFLRQSLLLESGRDEIVQQARYTLWEVEQHIAALEEPTIVNDARARIDAAVLDLLREVHETVNGLARGHDGTRQ